jgi:BirA family transcriptional regulator, biotin operon repressor / biotin---[acetyl-CoA-carboxylase] ligase
MDKSSSQSIDWDRLAQLLSPGARRVSFEFTLETASTNSDLITRLQQPTTQGVNSRLALPVVRIARQQTAGRGRYGRQWRSVAGNALLFSLADEMSRASHDLVGLSLATGCALLEGLRALPGCMPSRLALKWPNDILLDGAKLAGVLLETVRHTDQTTFIVIGIGVNLYGSNGVDTARHGAALLPTTLEQILAEVTITEVLAQLLNALTMMLARFSAEGLAPFLAAWCQDHAYTGHRVTLFAHGEEMAQGIVLGVDPLGRLLLKTDTGIQQIASGDLSLRLQEVSMLK